MNRPYSSYDHQLLLQFVNERYNARQPFCIVRLPKRDGLNDSLYVFFSDGDTEPDSRMQVKVKPWLASGWFDFTTTGNAPVPVMEVCPESTPQDKYCHAIAELVEILQKRGGKTVIARNICGRFHSFNLSRIITDFFNAPLPDLALTFLLWHPQMNFWIGSTPELVLERCHNGTYHTMALAGTRHIDVKQDWDIKNLQEHALVANDIAQRLALTGIDFFRMPLHDLTYGSIVHLATDFISSFVANGHDRKFFDNIVDEIQPTPALAGYPRPYALAEIASFEQWPRHLYAGILDICDLRLNMAYGMIRCAHFDENKWAIYTGSGITAQSLPYTEWQETQAKASLLLDCLSKI